ncbi:MAG TPA: cytochrome c biogenesis protein/redoxin [Pyrinomonadaceae bacterium]|nr:cytochrome c biogenesis protein/redoxin [Pyrinomonadaceae bacterium]
MTNISIPIAFLAGLASFLSPCVLPLVPGYLSLISGVSLDQLRNAGQESRSLRRGVIINSLAFNAGLSLIFVSLGAAAGLIGSAVLSSIWIRVAGGVVIIAFGFQMLGLLQLRMLYKDTRVFSDRKPHGPLGSLVLGIAFAAGWTPCIGPILGGIIGLAATSGGWRSGLFLSSFYAAGLAVPFLLTGLAINHFLVFYSRFRKHLHKVEVFSGLALILIGGAIASGYATRLASSRLASMLPNLEARIRPAEGGVQVVADGEALEQAPQLELETVNGKILNLESLHGHVVLLNFWATWCGPCRDEIPELNSLEHDFSDSGLKVIGVSWDDSGEGIRQFQTEIPQDYTVALGGENLQAQFAGIRSLPATIVIDREGRIRQKIIGARDKKGFASVVEPLLNETPKTND